MIREDQLTRTMDSLSRQTLKDFEVILVGDGTPHYEVLDEKIKVIDGQVKRRVPPATRASSQLEVITFTSWKRGTKLNRVSWKTI